ncbi:putative diacylglycerol kinase K06A1.6 [Ditylenchus destructor]|nr:putative diacylglycerol kinase K06A1.6 [Ditylenchus destructor]
MHEETVTASAAEKKRKQFAFYSSRSHSAPARKRRWWSRRGLLRRIGGSQHSLCYDLNQQVVTRRLIGAIAAWHDIHSNLLQLTLDQKNSDTRGCSSTPMQRRIRRESTLSTNSSSQRSTCSDVSSGQVTGSSTSTISSAQTPPTSTNGRDTNNKNRLSRPAILGWSEQNYNNYNTMPTCSQTPSYVPLKIVKSRLRERPASAISTHTDNLDFRNSTHFPLAPNSAPYNNASQSYFQQSQPTKIEWNDNKYSELSDENDEDEEVDGESDESDFESLISDELLDEIVELEKKSNLNKLSLSNPELTSVQLKELFPELSEHWRLVST